VDQEKALAGTGTGPSGTTVEPSFGSLVGGTMIHRPGSKWIPIGAPVLAIGSQAVWGVDGAAGVD
jgi:hypothetical protein